MIGYVILFLVCATSLFLGIYISMLVHSRRERSNKSRERHLDVKARVEHQERIKEAQRREKKLLEQYNPPVLDVEDLFMPEEWMLDEDGNPINEHVKAAVANDSSDIVIETTNDPIEDETYYSPLRKIDKSNSYTEFNCALDNKDEAEVIRENMKKQDRRYMFTKREIK